MKTLLALTALAALLSACATAYQEKGLTGGYSETQLGPNIFRVSFRGNAYTSRERAEDFTLLRAADVTLEKGFRYFVIVNSEAGTKVGAFTTPTTSYTTGSAYGYGNYAYGSATTKTYGGQTYLISKPSDIDTILCFKDRPQGAGLVYDAEFVSNSIRQKYKVQGQ